MSLKKAVGFTVLSLLKTFDFFTLVGYKADFKEICLFHFCMTSLNFF